MKLPVSDLDRIYITSDTHAFHVNICRGTTSRLDGYRDFDNPHHMTTQIAININSALPKDAILFHLGDWSFAGKQNIELFRNMLNVKELHLITGNHDEHIEKGEFDHLFTSRQKYLELEVGKMTFCLFHFPVASWNGIAKGWYHLHGHVHNKPENRFGNGRTMDVGLDGNDMMPYKLTDVIDLLKDRRFVSETDHHAYSR